jgi:hypothetical protein
MARSPLPGPNILLIGASGVGKTTSIKTLIAKGITPFCLFTEPGFEVLGDVPSPQLHWQYIAPASAPWESLIQVAKNVTMLQHDAVTAMKDSQKGRYTQYVQLLTALNSFKCDRDGKEYGDVCKWGTDRALVLDSLSGVNIMVMRHVIGGKPTSHQGEWGSAMSSLENLIQKLCTDTHCTFVLMAHAERETDEVQGGSKIMASTLGRKLAPRIPRFFSDVVYAKKEGAKFTWTTIEPNADLKNRNLPLADNLPPDFAQIITSWEKHGGTIGAE